MSEEDVLNRLEEAHDRIQSLEKELDAAERRLKRYHSGLIWTGWIAALSVLGFLLARTLLTGSTQPLPAAPPAPIQSISRPSKAPKSAPKPIYNPPPSVSPPAEMPGFSE